MAHLVHHRAQRPRIHPAVVRQLHRRYEITNVPAPVRNRDRIIGIGEPVLPRYERITFRKRALIAVPGPPFAPAALSVPVIRCLIPPSTLHFSVTAIFFEEERSLTRTTPVLHPRLFYLEHAIQDASLTRIGERRVISKQLLYVEIDNQGNARHMQYAPYLDYRPLTATEPGVDAIMARPECKWICRELEQKALGHAIASVVPLHLAEVRDPKLELIAKTEVAVKDRLTKEINYWDHRAEQLRLQEQAGRPNARLNSGEARKRADLLQGRLQKRLEDLKLEAQISPLPPVVLGGLLVVPAGLISAMAGQVAGGTISTPADTQASGAAARAIIMELERSLGFDPIDREIEKVGYDIESRVLGTGKLRFIEVKGRVSGAATITVTKNEILYSLNKPEDFILAIVEFQENNSHRVHYVRQPFKKEPDFGVTSVNYDFAELIERAETPR